MPKDQRPGQRLEFPRLRHALPLIHLGIATDMAQQVELPGEVVGGRGDVAVGTGQIAGALGKGADISTVGAAHIADQSAGGTMRWPTLFDSASMTTGRAGSIPDSTCASRPSKSFWPGCPPATPPSAEPR